MNLKEYWQENMTKQKLKFFVIKVEDFFNALDEEDVVAFNEMLKKNEEYRISLNKTPFNNYWVVNRDESYADEVKKIIEENEGVEL